MASKKKQQPGDDGYGGALHKLVDAITPVLMAAAASQFAPEPEPALPPKRAVDEVTDWIRAAGEAKLHGGEALTTQCLANALLIAQQCGHAIANNDVIKDQNEVTRG